MTKTVVSSPYGGEMAASQMRVKMSNNNNSQRLSFDNRDLKQEEAVKKTRRSTGKFSLTWNRGWLNFNSLVAASS